MKQTEHKKRISRQTFYQTYEAQGRERVENAGERRPTRIPKEKRAYKNCRSNVDLDRGK